MKTRKKYKKITRNRRSKIWKTRNRRSKIWKTRNRRTRTKNTKILIGGGEDYMSAYTKAINRFATITKSSADRIQSFILPIARKYIDLAKFTSVFHKHIQFNVCKKLTKEQEIDEIIKPAVSEIAKPILNGLILSNILYSAGIKLEADNLIDNDMKQNILQVYSDNENSLTKALLYDTRTVLLPEKEWKEEIVEETRPAKLNTALDPLPTKVDHSEMMDID
jgi:hypothetical protein